MLAGSYYICGNGVAGSAGEENEVFTAGAGSSGRCATALHSGHVGSTPHDVHLLSSHSSMHAAWKACLHGSGLTTSPGRKSERQMTHSASWSAVHTWRKE